ncbi:carboxylesterase family protein [Tsukamurella sp. 8F]|uniref:carboxylesterase/lipase family protein n=1 Tax=unclassified Tsukamurella TaxID=2633480 RepID=UPI0023BA20DB|nr:MULTISPECIES: carboxylesterase family protein [unclassified Tsukamurella]MDF0531530.1 carboxylesterase family protein [Tsukamurella sp. 8J]MDF0588858.1 carboxylesterase family protein [Tsukamurella sp. 8F]
MRRVDSDIVQTIVQTASGALSGVIEGGVARFLGIPYAESPARSGWLSPPVPAPPWEGVRPALEHGATVPKNPYPIPSRELLAEPDAPGDDCLVLNVWTPGTDGAAPVFVWIHGGAFRNGSGSVPQYDGSAFARDGVVCVTMNYRLGLFGFLDTGDGETNVGLRDQICALRWVRENIAAFGGDPERVTIGGESAGGMSVTSLLASPLAEGMFRGVIAQSGAGQFALSERTARAVSSWLADELGVDGTREAFAALPVAELLAAQEKLGLAVQTDPDPEKWGEIVADTMPFEPRLGDDVVPRTPIESVRAGAGSGVRVLVGHNADEMLFFLAIPGIVAGVDAAGFEAAAAMIARYGFVDPLAAVQAYRDDRHPTAGLAAAALIGDWFFGIPAVRLAEAAPDTSYVYRFDWASPVRGGILGSCHALEIGFAFDTLGTEGLEALAGPNPPQSVADEMHAAWVRFIVDGDPGWAPYTPDARTVRVFDLESRTETDPHPERRALWDGLR